MKFPLQRRVALKWLQAVLCVLTMVCGLGTFLPLGYVTRYFSSNCVLYSDVYVRLSANQSLDLDLIQTTWGDSNICNFATFLPVIAAVHAFIWVWFFFHMYRLLRAEGNEVYLALPAVLLHGILFFCAVGSSVCLSHGLSTFCSNLARNVKHKYTCDQLQLWEWHMHGQTIRFTVYLQIAQIFSWLMTLTLIAQCVVTSAKSYSECFPTVDQLKVLEEEGEGEEVGGMDEEYNQHNLDNETGSMLFLTPDTRPSFSGSSPGMISHLEDTAEESQAETSTVSTGESTQQLVV